MILRKRTSRQVRGGERVHSLILDLSAAEFRASELRVELLTHGLSADEAAWAAACTVPKPDPVFVAWLSDGHISVMAGALYPTNEATAHAMDAFLATA